MTAAIIPAVAGRYHQNLMNSVTFPYGNQRTFTISDVAENKLRIAMLESGWMMSGITLMDVDTEKARQLKLAMLHYIPDGLLRGALINVWQ